MGHFKNQIVGNLPSNEELYEVYPSNPRIGIQGLVNERREEGLSTSPEEAYELAVEILVEWVEEMVQNALTMAHHEETYFGRDAEPFSMSRYERETFLFWVREHGRANIKAKIEKIENIQRTRHAKDGEDG